MDSLTIELIYKILDDCDLETLLNVIQLNKFYINITQKFIFCKYEITYRKDYKFIKTNKMIKVKIYDLTDEDVLRLPNIEEMSLSGHYSNSCLQKFTKLKSLELSHCDKLSGVMDGLVNLKKLVCGWNSDISRNSLKKLINLEILECDDKKLKNRTLEHLTKLSELKFTDSQSLKLKDFSCMRNLKKLEILSGKNLTDDMMKQLINLEYLTLGKYAGELLTDEGFINMNKLKYFNVHCDLTDKCLLNKPHLETLDYKWCNFSSKAIMQLHELRELRIDGSLIFDETIQSLPHLETLQLQYSNLTDKAFIHSDKIYNLHLEWNPTGRVTDIGLHMLPNLVLLKISGKYITDDGFRLLPKIFELFIIGEHNISDEGLKWLIRLNRLEIEYSDRITCDGLLKLPNLEKAIIIGMPQEYMAYLQKHGLKSCDLHYY